MKLDEPRTLVFDMTNYLPGTGSMSGWLADQGETIDGFVNSWDTVEIRNFNKIHPDAGRGGVAAFLNNCLDLAHKGANIRFADVDDREYQPFR